MREVLDMTSLLVIVTSFVLKQGPDVWPGNRYIDQVGLELVDLPGIWVVPAVLSSEHLLSLKSEQSVISADLFGCCRQTGLNSPV